MDAKSKVLITKTWGQGQGELGTLWYKDMRFQLGGMSLSDLLCGMGLTSKNNIMFPPNCQESADCNWPHHRKQACEATRVLTSSAKSFTMRQEILSSTDLQGSASMAKQACAQQTYTILRFNSAHAQLGSGSFWRILLQRKELETTKTKSSVMLSVP